MSVFATIALVYVIGVIALLAYLAYTDATDKSLSADERVSLLAMAGYALIWPALAVMWVLTKFMSLLRWLHS